MHLADSLISPAVAGTMYVASGLMTAYSIHKLRKEDDLKRKIPTMGVMGAFVFATQMINFTIPGTGASGHLCGGIIINFNIRTLCRLFKYDRSIINSMFVLC